MDGQKPRTRRDPVPTRRGRARRKKLEGGANTPITSPAKLAAEANRITREIAKSYFPGWDITVTVVAELANPGEITYNMALRRARIKVLETYEDMTYKTLTELIAHELGHICAGAFLCLPDDLQKATENIEQDIADRFSLVLMGRSMKF